MTASPIKIPAGIVKVDSPYAALGRWIDADKVRFVKNNPEKLGGTERLIEDVFDGIARGAEAWTTFGGVACLMFGTACDIYLVRNNIMNRVTPFRLGAVDIALSDPFDTTDTSAIVTVTDAGHGIAEAGTVVVFSGAAAVGGITIDGEYAVTEILTANTFTITHSAPATSTANGGGASVLASYEINCGDVDPNYLLGYGVGLYGYGGYGVEVSFASASRSEPRVWVVSNYGEDLILNYLDGPIYYYDASAGVVRPTILANSPAENRSSFVTPERYIFALGCTNIAGSQDPMTVRWPDVFDSTDWMPSDINTANERKLQGGTRLIAGAALMDGTSLVWSDSDVFTFQFTGSSTVYSSRSAATNCGLLAPHAQAIANGSAFWMGSGQLWMYSGFVQPIPNSEDITQWVYDRLNDEMAFKAFAFFNPLFNEIWFVFPTGASTEPDTYVMVSLINYAWVNGTWDRTAHAQYPSGETRPIMFGTNGHIYRHDLKSTPNDDNEVMTAFLEFAPFDVRTGNVSVDVFGFIPDFQRQTGDISLYLYGKDHPNDTVMMEDTVTIGETDKYAEPRLAGRQIGGKFTSSVIGGDFRFGTHQLDVSVAGSKR